MYRRCVAAINANGEHAGNWPSFFISLNLWCLVDTIIHKKTSYKIIIFRNLLEMTFQYLLLTLPYFKIKLFDTLIYPTIFCSSIHIWFVSCLYIRFQSSCQNMSLLNPRSYSKFVMKYNHYFCLLPFLIYAFSTWFFVCAGLTVYVSVYTILVHCRSI